MAVRLVRRTMEDVQTAPLHRRAPPARGSRPGARRDVAWWELASGDVARRLGTDVAGGLSREEAAARLVAEGPNELERGKNRSKLSILLGQIANTMIVVLLAAAAVTLAIGDVRDAAVILAVIVLNAAIGYAQDRRAERAMAALHRMTSPLARVTRSGVVRTVPSSEVVPGDLLLLEAGDLVAADARLVHAPNLRANEAPLTGESVPVEKTGDPMDGGGHTVVADRRNMVFKGTAVAYGRGRAVVTATGMSTAIGEIAGLLQAHRAPPTPLQRQLAVLGRRLAFATVAICAVIFAVGLARGEPADDMFFTAVSLAVAAIPESLPAVVTMSMALGAHRMARRRALVRKLSAVEALGSVTVVATDKTGTLTQGRMQVERVWTPGGEFEVTGSGYEPVGLILRDGEPVTEQDVTGLHDLLVAAVLANDAHLAPPARDGEPWEVVGDPTEGALLVLAAKAELDPERVLAQHPRVGEIPFDSHRKRMTTMHRSPTGEIVVAAKGAPEILIPTLVAAGEELAATGKAADYAARGFRVLAIAGGRLDRLPTRPERAEGGLVLLGLVAMADPPRDESAAAVAAARSAGIHPVMITGDHPATGRAIAARLGILREGGGLMTGAELEREGPDHLARHVEHVAVYARTTPEQKLDIVEAWRARGHVVAMTGDGVNDAPALRRADVGVAMGRGGTEVAKEAADVVLADDNFATIVGAVEEGRRIYDNIRRFVRYGLTGGSGAIWAIFLAPFLGLPLPLLPIQILWINLVTHGLPGVALGVEPAERNVLERPPRRPDESVFAGGMAPRILRDGFFVGLISLALGLWGHATGRPWQTMVFTTLALLQLGNALALRSDRDSLFTLGFRSNRFLSWVVLGTLVVQIAIVYAAPLQAIIKTEPLSPLDLAVVLAASTGAFWIVEAEKLLRRRRTARASALGREETGP